MSCVVNLTCYPSLSYLPIVLSDCGNTSLTYAVKGYKQSLFRMVVGALRDFFVIRRQLAGCRDGQLLAVLLQ